MKLLFLIFIIYINYCLSQNNADTSKRIIFKPFPKKVKPGLITYNNAGNYVKKNPLAAPVVIQKKNVEIKDYTAFAKPFPRVNADEHQVVPDSPYFPVGEPGLEQKRVKKVLPVYTPLLMRHKRSAIDKNDDDRKSKLVHKRIHKNIKRHEKPSTPDDTKIIDTKISKKDKATGKNGEKRIVPRPYKTGKKKHNSSNNKTKSGSFKRRRTTAESGHSRKIKLRNKKRTNDRYSQKKTKLAHTHNPSKQVKKERNRKKKDSHSVRNHTDHRGVKNRKGPDGRRLIAARDALIEEYPYVISIQKEGKHWCSGALLNPRVAITTANCLWRSNSISNMRVRAGSRHTDRDGQLAKIQEVMKHPGWNLRSSPDNDVALILLDRNIRFSHSVHGVDLPNRIMMPPFDDVWITSWGSDRRDGIYDTKGMSLQVYHARLLERDKCNNVTQRFGVSVTENFICLAQTGRRAPCTRDTGAPAVSDGVLWGLASWGIRKLCGTERFPAMFSYLGSKNNMDFIANATRLLMSDERQYPFMDRFPIAKVSLTMPTPMTLPY